MSDICYLLFVLFAGPLLVVFVACVLPIVLDRVFGDVHE